MREPVPRYSEVIDAFNESRRIDGELHQLLIAIGTNGAPPDLERSLEFAGQQRVAFDKFMQLFRRWQQGMRAR